MSDFESISVIKTPKSYKSPPGFELSTGSKKSDTAAQIKKQDPKAISDLKAKKAWEIAMGPAKSIPMNLFMSYMTGNSLQIIPIMMAFNLFMSPLKAIFTETNKNFKQLITPENSNDILVAKAIFVLCQLACMSVGVWKLNTMGLIPRHRSDWLAWEEVVQVKEWSSIF
ncbi:ER membrane protein complex subunit 4 [[Candida] railenensis]|uniref:ER membrane protein complex subunit 4 n=1 Tax=[Candida] railenensis TaxID=45579 RepID=A0A9P0QRX6_9ASCO|nr:ER membrane protein complex subunit 4 [[Candida] railenensis]